MRVKLVPFQQRHISNAYIDWLNDKDLLKYSEQRHFIHTKKSCQKYLASFSRSPNEFLAIETNNCDTRHIGNVTLKIDPFNLVGDISILLGDREYMGMGLGLEAWELSIRRLFAKKMRIVTGGCMATNLKMIKIMKRSGMVPYFTRHQAFLLDGKKVDSVHYAKVQVPVFD